MRKLIIALLVVMLSLGLSGLVYAATGTGDQTVEASITPTLALTVPADISSWSLSTIGDNIQSSGDINIKSNAPYHITIKADDTETYGSGSSGHMNKFSTVYTTSDQTGADNFLDSALQFAHTSTTGATVSSAAATTALTTGDQTIVYITDSATPEAGYDTVATFTQAINYDDPVLTSGLVWHIIITYTATQDLP